MRIRQIVRSRQKAVALGFVAVALATACGSSSKSSGGSSSSKSSGSSSSLSSGSSSDQSGLLGAPNKATGTPVKIGLFNAEGGTGLNFPEIRETAVAAANYANNYLGGLAGHPIDIDRCDDKGDGASAIACANKFVSDKVAAVVVGQPAQAELFQPIISRAKIPYFGSSVTAPAESAGTDGVFLTAGVPGLVAGMAQWAKSHGVKTFGLFLYDVPQAVGTVAAIGKAVFPQVGVQLQIDLIPPATADATPQVEAALSKHPDGLGIILDDATCQATLTALQTAGGTKLPTVTNQSCADDPVKKAIGAAGIDGLNVITYPVNSNFPEMNLFKAVIAKYAPATNVNGFGPGGYLSMLSFVRAVKSTKPTGELTTTTIDAAIHSAANVPIPLSPPGSTFSCDKSAIGKTLIQATICSATTYYVKMSGTMLGSTAIPINYGSLLK